MPWVNGEELAALEAAKEQLDETQRQLRIAQAAGPIATEVAAAIDQFSSSGEPDEAALGAAQMFVLESKKTDIINGIKEGLLKTRQDELVTQMRKKEEPKLKPALDAELRDSGAYDRVAQEAEDEVRKTLRDQLLAEEKSRVTDELNSPASKQEIVAGLRTEIQNSDQMRTFRGEVSASLEKTWKGEVRADVQAAIETEERAREPEFKAAYETEYRGTDSARRHRADVKYRLEQDWRTATVEKVHEATGDEELGRLLDEKKQQAVEKLRRENRARELLTAFEGGGIDVSAIDRDSSVVIYLGEMRQELPERNHNYGDKRDKPVLYSERTLTLHALGDNRFRVRGDSLKDSKSVWERAMSISDGTVISIGNLLSENGQHSLEPRLSADAHFHYDDDTTTPATFTEMAVPVANVMIDGIAAREVREVKSSNRS